MAVVAAMADVSRADIKVLSRAACRRQLRAVLPMNKCPRRPSPLQTVAALVASVVVPPLCWRFLVLDPQGSPRKMSVIIWFGDTASYLPHGRRRGRHGFSIVACARRCLRAQTCQRLRGPYRAPFANSR